MKIYINYNFVLNIVSLSLSKADFFKVSTLRQAQCDILFIFK